MTKLIDFAVDLTFPLDVATQTLAFIARKRAGKSYAAGKLVEGLYANGVQFVVVDPVGNWYGLRLAADGKNPGLDIPVLGGLRGDIPLDPHSGKLVADAIIDTGRSFVLDVSQFSLADRKRFVTALGEQLWHRQKGLKDPQPIHVILEEAQLFLPQQIFKGDEHMVGIWTEIVRLGGNKGIGVTLITQRPQSVSKEALTQVECLVVLQVNGVPEKKALKEWIVEKGIEKMDLLEELPFLKRGVAYIWSPQWLEHYGKHEIGSKWTFDAGATPKVGVKRVAAELKPIDLDHLREQMAEAVSKAELNDPRALKKRCADLEKQLLRLVTATQAEQAKKTRVVTETKVETREIPVLTDKDVKSLEKHLERVGVVGERLQSEQLRLQSELKNYGEAADRFANAMRARFAAAPPPRGLPASAKKPLNGHHNGVQKPIERRLPVAQPLRTTRSPVPEGEDGEQKLGRGAREMIRALACRHPNPLSRGQVATLAGISPRSSTFRNYMSILRVQQFIREDGAGMHITDAGFAYLGDDVPDSPTTTEELVSLWSSKFTGKVNDMLRVLVDQHPNGLSKEELGEQVGISVESSTFRNYLSMLRSNELIEKTHEGGLKASDTLFPS